MLRITRQSDYGIVLLTRLAGLDPARETLNAAELAAQTALPLPMVSKVLKVLTRAGLLRSQRGALGGYALARPASEINVSEIIGALEGPIAITECLDTEHGSCDHQQGCPVRANWMVINVAIENALAAISLAEMSSSVLSLSHFSR